MLVIILILLLVGLGCAGPGASSTDEHAGIGEEACLPWQYKAEYDGRCSQACRPQRSWFQQVAEALGGAVSAFRAPSP